MPKSEIQARGELSVTRKMIENFSGDQVLSFLALLIKLDKIPISIIQCGWRLLWTTIHWL